MNEKDKSSLTDTEWISLIDIDREGLPECCPNIANLRDEVIMVARYGGDLPPWNAVLLLRAFRVAVDGHDWMNEEQCPILWKLLREVAESRGHTLEEIMSWKHEGSGEVCIGTDQVEAIAQRVVELLKAERTNGV